jgi:FAD dependent oxidoreductase TIGR03364
MDQLFSTHYDLAVVGAGILGLAHALAAARRGKRVIVIDRDAQANGASIRNFGFVTVTGQERGATWERARRSREVWAEVAPAAGISVLHRGLVMVARRPEAAAVLKAFLATEMGEGCRLIEGVAAKRDFPVLAGGPVAAALWSPHELRIESREAIPRLAAWLAAAHGVAFLRQASVLSVEPPFVETSRGRATAEAAIVCPGDDLVALFPERIAAHGVTRCKLHMLRLAEPAPGWRLPAALMSDLGLVRYLGYARLPEAETLRRVLETEQKPALDNGVHLIVVQSADGSLVVGDSHHYSPTPDPFQPESVDALILDEFAAVTGLASPRIVERWTGTYSSAAGPMFVDRVSETVRLAMITSGTGASTSFAIAEEVVADLYGNQGSTP